MRRFRNLRVFAWLAVLALVANQARGVTISINYDLDTAANKFFGTGNPQGASAGAQAKTAMDAAASFFSNILTDTFSAIQTPAQFHGQFGGTASWQWTAQFPNPATGLTNAIPNLSVPANQYIVYVGARSLSGSEAGLGGPGAFSRNFSQSGAFTPAEQTTIDQTNAQFNAAVPNRGETTGFADWGGAIAFDSDASTVWHFNHLTAPSGSEVDFYSVALHEIAHTLGFGTLSSPPSVWQGLLSSTTFIGDKAKNEFGGPVPLSGAADLSHWANGTASRVFGGAANQEVLMDPSLTQGTRKLLTRLDAAALIDLGWSITLPPIPKGDYNKDGFIDAADYTVWRDQLGRTGAGLAADGSGNGTVDTADFNLWKSNYGQGAGSGGLAGTGGNVPEPASAALAMLGVMMLAGWRRYFATRSANDSRTRASHSSLGGP